MTTGEKMRARRLELGWTQADLANEAEVSPSTISSIERGDHYPPDETIAAIAHALGRRPEALRRDPTGSVRLPVSSEGSLPVEVYLMTKSSGLTRWIDVLVYFLLTMLGFWLLITLSNHGVIRIR